ncbi:SMC-Scp complex subunit ScpB [Sporosarcina sp. HYO08]|uniref:SMC-Scp complex subunit ScpB n=1 Tax=Sporosarcina sp. HYO08 TaxID=1759557 RepID=UPI00079A6FE4|nr:SMC-Scp complex subunit ScpB [Sporosarcina sp. HYO08]KXH82056.1 segregation and condensation protein B [Sporosarcina sp. HYO08]
MEVDNQIVGKTESFLFLAGDEGLSVRQLMALTEQSEEQMLAIIGQLKNSYEQRQDSGLTLKLFGGSYRLVTKAEYADDIKKLLENSSPKSITQASLEVLAIIAYQQPVTRVEIDDLRGVKSEGPIHTLISNGLIMEKGRLEGSGRAILYGTTDLFLDRFGLASLSDLPPLMHNDEEDVGDTDLFMTQFQEAFEVDNNGGGNHS